MKKEKFKILLVDDEKEFVESLSERLKLRDLDAEIAFDGEQALEAVKKGAPDIMVLDLRMPGIDGIEVLRRVKDSHPHIQIVILTGHGTEKDEEAAERFGAFAYMTKPVNIDQLVSNVHSAWERLKKIKARMDTAFMAAALAQAGQTDMAREAMSEITEDENKDKDKKEE